MNYQPSLFNHGKTQCACCDTVVRLDEAVVKTYHVGEHHSITEHWCSERCKQEWYLGRLRVSGL